MQYNFILRSSPLREIFPCHNLAFFSLAMSAIRSQVTFWSFGVCLLQVSQFMLISCRCSTPKFLSLPPSLPLSLPPSLPPSLPLHYSEYSLGSCDRCIGPEYNSFYILIRLSWAASESLLKFRLYDFKDYNDDWTRF